MAIAATMQQRAVQGLRCSLPRSAKNLVSQSQNEVEEAVAPATPQQRSLSDLLEGLPPELRNQIFELFFHVPCSYRIDHFAERHHLRLRQINAFLHGQSSSHPGLMSEMRPYARDAHKARSKSRVIIDLDRFTSLTTPGPSETVSTPISASQLRQLVQPAALTLEDADVQGPEFLFLRTTAFSRTGEEVLFPLSKGIRVRGEGRSLPLQSGLSRPRENFRTMQIGFELSWFLRRAYGPHPPGSRLYDLAPGRESLKLLLDDVCERRVFRQVSLGGNAGQWKVDELVEIVLVACLLVQKYGCRYRTGFASGSSSPGHQNSRDRD